MSDICKIWSTSLRDSIFELLQGLYQQYCINNLELLQGLYQQYCILSDAMKNYFKKDANSSFFLYT